MRRLRRLRRRPLSRAEKVGAASLGGALALVAVGVVAGLILDRLISFDDSLDAGGEWDEGGGVRTRWY